MESFECQGEELRIISAFIYSLIYFFECIKCLLCAVSVLGTQLGAIENFNEGSEKMKEANTRMYME